MGFFSVGLNFVPSVSLYLLEQGVVHRRFLISV